jgi:MOSC domain-containing protein YiiM
MKVRHTSVAQAVTISLNGTPTQTGIYKQPQQAGIMLAPNDVVNDAVIDRKYHGGEFKACYFFGANNYDQFKKQFPDSPWQPAMFGENITLTNLDENTMMVGNIYSIGEAVVQISEPRMPCSKLAHKFENKDILKAFTQSNNCGVYVKVITSGLVKPNDEMVLQTASNSRVSISDVYAVMANKNKDAALIERMLQSSFVTPECKESIRKKQ